MELKKYARIILKRIWIIIALCTIAGVVSAYMNYFVITPVYEANTTLYVNNKSDNKSSTVYYNDILSGQQLAKDYTEIIKSRAVTGEVIKQLGLTDITSDDLIGLINVDSVNETRVMQISVQNTDPNLALEIANKTADVFSEKVVDLMNVQNVNIIDKAERPELPIKPNKKANIVFAVFVSGLLAIGIIFFIEYMDNTIKTTEDVKEYLELNVIGTIPVLKLK